MPGTGMAALYVTAPSFLPEDMALIHTEEGDVVLAWLMPIFKAEAEYIFKNGWEPFEALLEQEGVDVYDLARPCTILTKDAGYLNIA